MRRITGFKCGEFVRKFPIFRRKIPGFNGKYRIGFDGSVWKSDGKELKPHSDGTRSQYRQVTLHLPGWKKTYRIHVLMGLTWLGFHSDYWNVVDHKDEDKQNNFLRNLQRLTTEENTAKARKHKRDSFKAEPIEGVPF